MLKSLIFAVVRAARLIHDSFRHGRPADQVPTHTPKNRAQRRALRRFVWRNRRSGAPGHTGSGHAARCAAGGKVRGF